MVNPKSSHNKIKQEWSLNVRDSIKLLDGSYNMFDQSHLIHIINKKKTINFVKKSTSIIILSLSTNYRYILTAMPCADGNFLVQFSLWLNNYFTNSIEPIIQQMLKISKTSFKINDILEN